MRKRILVFITAVLLLIAMLAGCNAAVPEGNTDVSENVGSPNGTEASEDVSFEQSDDNAGIEVSGEQSGDYDPSIEISTAPDISQEPETSEPDTSEPDTSEPVEPPLVPNPIVKRPTLQIPAITTPVWDGSAAEGFASGTGTQADPFIIETAEQLAFFANSVNGGTSYEGQFVCLANNIKLNEGTPSPESGDNDNKWTSIGTANNRFKGTFDGKGNVVAGVYENSLFGVVQGNVANVGVVYSYVYGGGVINTAVRDNLPDMISISNCYFAEGTVIGGGGIAMSISGTNLDNCSNWGTVICDADWCGGIVGFSQMSYITNCYNGGTVSGDSTLGGIVGHFSIGKVTYCLNEGDVNGSFFSAGIIGNSFTGIYMDLVNTGKISGSKCAGILIEMSDFNPLDFCYYLEGTAEYGSNSAGIAFENLPQFAISVTEDKLSDLIS